MKNLVTIMRNNNIILAFTILLTTMQTLYTSKASAIVFDENTRYSVLVINSRLNDFYANTTHMGLGMFDDDGRQTVAESGTKNGLDYVPGLVAKAILEAVDYYKDNEMVDVKPWFYAVQNYGCAFDIKTSGKSGQSFDDLNAVKIYSLLQNFCESKTFADGAVNTNASTLAVCSNRFSDALNGIKTANKSYFISSSLCQDATGGWWHKSSYANQMWCDGQYMGPALLAQIINDYQGYTMLSTTGDDWELLTKQLDIVWNHLWDSSAKLLYHGFSASPSSDTWATKACPDDKKCKHNAAFWGRADAWYMFALVDILEQMDKAEFTHDDPLYVDLRQKLNALAEGIAARQDEATGCWHQLLDKATSYKPSSYSKGNYIESSATAIFTAAFLKAMRLGYLDTDYTDLAKKAYRGMVENFMISDGNGGVHLVKSCRSAGLGMGRDGTDYYYLNGSDVTVTTNQTEGKVLGAFIMAATEYERRFIDQSTAIKMVSNAVSYADSKTYSITGMQVSSVRKGNIYIKGGKKVLK